MWLVESKFEGSKENVRKLLKPGNRYEVGRKIPAKLILSDKTVSQDAGYIEVEKWTQTQSELQDINYSIEWPKIRLHSGKKLIRIISKEDEDQWKANPEGFIGEEVQANRERELEDGDLIIFTRSSPPIRIILEPFLFWVTPNVIPLNTLRLKQKSLSSLGIPIIESPNMVKGASHLITQSTIPSAHLLEALVSQCFIVTSKYIEEFLESDSLEQEYTLPNLEDYFPAENDVDDITYEEIKSKSKPDERRRHLLKGMTILCATADDEARRLFKETLHIYQSSGAYTEVCSSASLNRFSNKKDVEQFLETKLEEAIDRSQSSNSRNTSSNPINLVLITSTKDSDMNWYPWLASVSRKLNIYMPEEGLRALQNTILMMSPSRFLTKLAPEQEEGDDDEDEDEVINHSYESIDVTREEIRQPDILNEQVPMSAQDNTEDIHAAEPDQAPVLSHTEQAEPERVPAPSPPNQQNNQTQFVVPQTPSRRPRRRAGIEKVNPFEDLFGSFSGPPPTTQKASGPAAMIDASQNSSMPPTQQSPSQSEKSKSRKNATSDRQNARRSDIWQSIFEESNVAASSAASMNAHSLNSKERYSKRFRQELEEEERQSTQRSQARTQLQTQDADTTVRPQNNKRRAEEEVEDERDIDDASQPPTQKNGTQSSQINARQGPTSTQDLELIAERPSNTDGELAKDDRFLQSLTSLKKSKKHVDALDKEFDSLRIAKPQHVGDGKNKSKSKETTILAREDEIDDPDFLAWQKMSIDDFNLGAAGNFIQVDFVPLIRANRNVADKNIHDVGSANTTQTSWQKRPNFKKFRSKDRMNRRSVVMDLTEPDDFGMGDRYIAESSIAANKNSRMQKHNATQSRSNIATSQKRSIFDATNGVIPVEEAEEGEDDGLLSTMQRRKGKSTTQSTQNSRQRSRTRMEESNELDTRSSNKNSAVDLDLEFDDSRGMIEDDEAFFQDSLDQQNESLQSRSRLTNKNQKAGIIENETSSPTKKVKSNNSQSKISTFLTPAKRTQRKSVFKDNHQEDIDDDDDDDDDEGFTFKGFKKPRF